VTLETVTSSSKMQQRSRSPAARRARSKAAAAARLRRRARRAAEQQRYRANVAAGRRIARAPYDAAVLDYLIAMRWLDPKHAGDAGKIGEAYFKVLREAAAAQNKR
jgi:hypothetical protein